MEWKAKRSASAKPRGASDARLARSGEGPLAAAARDLRRSAPAKKVYGRNAYIADAVAAGSVDFGLTDVAIDDRFRKYFGLRTFNSDNKCGWLDALKSCPGVRMSVHVEPSDPERIRKAVDHTDARAGVNLLSGGSASRSIENQVDRDHARSMMGMIIDRQKAFVNCAFLFSMERDTLKDLAGSYARLRDACRPAGLTLDPLARAQDDAFRLCEPMNRLDDAYLRPRFEIDMPTDTLGAALLHDSAGIMDAHGTFLGTDSSGAVIQADMLTPTAERTNMNGTITGKSGKGKSHLLKMIALDEYARRGSRVIWLDFEQEAKHVCREVHGQYINGTSKGVKCCPTQYRALNFNYEEELSGDDALGVVDVLRSTISFLDGFYQIAFGIGKDELSYLEEGLVAAYGSKGVTYETPYDQIDFDDYPSMEEIADTFSDMARGAESASVRDVYERLAAHSRRGAERGLFGNMWSGETNISIDSDFVVFDLSSLANLPDEVCNAQMYSILSFVWSEICRARFSDKPLRLIVDEAHMAFGGTGNTTGDRAKSPIAAALLSSMVRRARKYNSGIIMATQSLSDFYAESVREHSKAIFEMSTYSFCFQEEDLEALRTLVRIPDDKAEELYSYGKGHCVFRAGSEMTELHVDAAERLQKWLGRGGGR